MNMGGLTDEERERYHRQILISDWGERAQIKLRESVVFVAGAGGLGSPVIAYLAAGGIGTLRICDDGELELSNLNRQVIHAEAYLQRKKVDSAVDAVGRLNRNVIIETCSERIRSGNVGSIVGDAHIMVDCLDNFETRYILNEYAVQTGIPLVHAGVTALSGQLTFVHPPETPCLACMFPTPPEGGIFPILGATAGIIGSLQSLETLKYLAGSGSLLKSRILFFDGGEMRFHVSRENKLPSCTVCGHL
jgi:adenylyltransferase/sulfurtransferase